jgi:hypothetical protein
MYMMKQGTTTSPQQGKSQLQARTKGKMGRQMIKDKKKTKEK